MGGSGAKIGAALAAAGLVLAGCSGAGRTPAAEAGCGHIAASEAGRQTRAMWIATVGNTDWPSRPGLSPARQRAEYRRLLDVAVRLNLNTVYVQVRPSADAFYPSPYEPWSRYLTGVPGRDPGYDPLRFMISEAHARGLEFHAWFNPYRVSTGPSRSALAPGSPARRHPDWVRRYGDVLWYDPGLPRVRALITQVVLDVVRRYDIDGVHFDDYFYPYPVDGKDFPDKATFRRYGAGFRSVGDWRRHNVDLLVQDLHRRIPQVKPWVMFGISPFGVWRNRSADPNGSRTRALESYADIYADTRTWIKRGWLDYVVPQLYWPIGFSAADYRVLVPWWAAQVRGTPVRLVIGQAAYRVGRGGRWNDPAELSRHLAIDARYPQVGGEAFFSARDLAQDRRGFATRLLRDRLARPALPPVTARGAGAPPPAPTRVRVRDGRLWWSGPAAAAYAIYRAPSGGPACARPSARQLVKVVPGGVHETAVAGPGRAYTYYVAALDARHRQSPAARAVPTTAGRG